MKRARKSIPPKKVLGEGSGRDGQPRSSRSRSQHRPPPGRPEGGLGGSASSLHGVERGTQLSATRAEWTAMCAIQVNPSPQVGLARLHFHCPVPWPRLGTISCCGFLHLPAARPAWETLTESSGPGGTRLPQGTRNAEARLLGSGIWGTRGARSGGALNPTPQIHTQARLHGSSVLG